MNVRSSDCYMAAAGQMRLHSSRMAQLLCWPATALRLLIISELCLHRTTAMPPPAAHQQANSLGCNPALGSCAGHRLVRINLSDQTDMMDLLGADLPASDGAAGHFAWSDGPLLQAIQQGHWVLLDELNLAGVLRIVICCGSTPLTAGSSLAHAVAHAAAV